MSRFRLAVSVLMLCGSGLAQRLDPAGIHATTLPVRPTGTSSWNTNRCVSGPGAGELCSSAHAMFRNGVTGVTTGGSGPEEPESPVADQDDGVFHVHPGMSIQDALEKAAADPSSKTVRVHEGTYRPAKPGQALVWFNARHDGITLEAMGEVTLTAANPESADPEMPSYPAIVNHVVYFGDGISRKTVFRGFRITGANDYYTDAGVVGESIEPALDSVFALRVLRFFYADGGGIKIFGRSFPTIENVDIHDNYAVPCGAGISIDHRGYAKRKAVLIRNCIVRGNRVTMTGAAIDLLPGSAAVIENCLFVDNVSNVAARSDYTEERSATYHRKHGSGALTVFSSSRCVVKNSTFTRNWNGVDDEGKGNRYENCIFWDNTAEGGVARGDRYEIDIENGKSVSGCFVNGTIDDLRESIDPDVNVLDAPDPEFDEDFRPRAKEYEGVGYRPVTKPD